MTFAREVEFARRAAAAAGENAKRIRAGGISPETKPDLTPVTIADRDNERMLREMIETEFPADGILGEEGAAKVGHSGRRWLIDPIDGTRDFVRGNRFWCVLLALEQNGAPVAGVAHFPLLGETYWASRGEGAWCNGERLHVSAVDRLSQAVLSPNGLHHPAIRPYAARVTEFLQRVWTVRTYGGALDACLLAGGHIDAWFEAKAEVWDLAPLRIIIEEAGGHYISPAGVAAIACTPALEREMRELFGGE